LFHSDASTEFIAPLCMSGGNNGAQLEVKRYRVFGSSL